MRARRVRSPAARALTALAATAPRASGRRLRARHSARHRGVRPRLGGLEQRRDAPRSMPPASRRHRLSRPSDATQPGRGARRAVSGVAQPRSASSSGRHLRCGSVHAPCPASRCVRAASMRDLAEAVTTGLPAPKPARARSASFATAFPARAVTGGVAAAAAAGFVAAVGERAGLVDAESGACAVLLSRGSDDGAAIDGGRMQLRGCSRRPRSAAAFALQASRPIATVRAVPMRPTRRRRRRRRRRGCVRRTARQFRARWRGGCIRRTAWQIRARRHRNCCGRGGPAR